MSSQHLVDPALLPLLEAFLLGPLSDARLPEVRTWLSGMIAPRGEELQPAETFIRGEPGSPDVRLLVYDPGRKNGDRPAILHIHGGGTIIGTPELNHPANAAWAATLGAVIVSVDYRLAPESPFPAALDDCHAALRWLHRNAKEMGIDAARIAVMGESAGGGLAANLALRARDGGEFAIAFQLLAYPMLDDRTGLNEAAPPLAGEFIWTAADNRYAWRSYLGPHAEGTTPYAAAARAADLRGLPPCFMSLGALDLFLGEDLLYARRLIEAGVPTELHVHPGGVHAFDLLPGTRIGATYARERVEAMQRALGLSG